MKTKLNQKPNLTVTVQGYLDGKVSEDELRQALQSWKLMEFMSTTQELAAKKGWTRKWK